MRSLIAALVLALSACALPEPHVTEYYSADAGSLCANPSLAYPSCAGCHEEAATAAGWYEETHPECLPGDSWGRSAFFILFTQGGSADIPEHAESYELAEECFCTQDPAHPGQCRTLTGDWPGLDGCAE